MKRIHRYFYPLAAVALLSSAMIYQAVGQPAHSTGFTPVIRQEPHPQRVLINLKHANDDLHAAFMALKIGKGLREHGASVTLFLNLEGARLADKRLPEDLKWGISDATVGSLLAAFVEAGGKVLVCPHCAAAIGLEPTDLRPGMTIVDHEGVMQAFLTAEKVIDY